MNTLVIVLLVVAVAWAVYHTVKKSKKGGGCCGEHETVKHTTVTDRNKSHYPYEVELDIAGMTCENCAVRVENALDALSGVWAKVDLESRKVKVLMKAAPDEKIIRNAVTGAGYVVMGYRLK